MRRDDRRTRLEMAAAIREALIARGVARDGAAVALELSRGEAEAIWIGDVTDLPVETLSGAVRKSGARGVVSYKLVDISESRAVELVEQRRTALAADAISHRLPSDDDVAMESWLVSDRGRGIARVLFVLPTLQTVTVHDGRTVACGDIGDGEWLPGWIEIDALSYLEHVFKTSRGLMDKWGEAIQLARATIANRVVEHAAAITKIAADHGFDSIRIVGSIARGEEKLDSDLDLLCDARPGTTLIDELDVMTLVEKILEVKLDLITTGRHLTPDQRARLDAEAIPILEFAASRARQL